MIAVDIEYDAIEVRTVFGPSEFMMTDIYVLYSEGQVCNYRVKTQNNLWSLWRVPKQGARELKGI